MNLSHFIDIGIITISIFITFLISLQAKKMWKIKSELERFLSNLKELNRSVKKIMDSSAKNKYKSFNELIGNEQKICESCKNRTTFIDFSFNNIFYYKCKLNNKEIKLSHTCKSYQKDLQNSKI